MERRRVPHPNEAEVALDRARARWQESYASLASAVSEGADRELWREHGAGSMVSWLANELTVTRSTARRWISDGRALRLGADFPPVRV